MRSAIHDVFGDPASVLYLADMPLPEPAAGDVRIRTILSPIHNHDLWTVRGAYGYKPVLPAIGGSEAVKILLPSQRCSIRLAVGESQPLQFYLDQAVRLLGEELQKRGAG